MAGYLERYQAGEYVQVWKELVALGDTVRTESTYSEARAVAQETMRRARHNIELLVKRLKALDFQFHDPSDVFTPTTSDQLEQLTLFEQEVGFVPLSVRAWVEQVGTVNFMGTYPRLSYYVPQSNFFDSAVIGGPGGQPQKLDPSDFSRDALEQAEAIPSEVKDVFRRMFDVFGDDIERMVGGAVPDNSSDKTLPESEQAVSDPLVVDFYELSLELYADWQYDNPDEPFVVSVAPDIFHKSGMSGNGGYEIELPSAGADTILQYTEWRAMTFVEYLRLSFEWGGFPGLQDYDHVDPALLDSLKEGLLPL